MGLCISKQSASAFPYPSSGPTVSPATSQFHYGARHTQPPNAMPVRGAKPQANASGIERLRVRQPAPLRARSASARTKAAELAQQATDPEHPKYMDLSAAMCWDAVRLCAVAVRAVDRNVDAQQGLVSHADALVVDRDAVASLPAGFAVGFFEGQRLVHAMLTVGDGHACGNKNDCIGLGHAVGWEALDLRNLRWDGNGGITAPGLLTPERTLQVRARPLGN